MNYWEHSGSHSIARAWSVSNLKWVVVCWNTDTVLAEFAGFKALNIHCEFLGTSVGVIAVIVLVVEADAFINANISMNAEVSVFMSASATIKADVIVTTARWLLLKSCSHIGCLMNSSCLVALNFYIWILDCSRPKAQIVKIKITSQASNCAALTIRITICNLNKFLFNRFVIDLSKLLFNCAWSLSCKGKT